MTSTTPHPKTGKRLPVRKPHVDVRYSVAVHGRHVPRRIVLHSWQAEGSIEGVAGFWQRQGMGLGSQFMVETSGRIGQGASSTALCYHVAGHNTGSIGIELEGFAQWSRSRWMRNARQLHRTAKLLAYLSKRWGIPLRRSTDHGVCLHADFHGSHWDPGPGFPIYWLILLARTYKRVGW